MSIPILAAKLYIPPPRPNVILRPRLIERLSAGPHRKLTLVAAPVEALERGNFFVVPLDDTRDWYRYHHLFADVLAAHLRAELPDQVATLHRCARGGTSSMAQWPMRSVTRLPPRISHTLRT